VIIDGVGTKFGKEITGQVTTGKILGSDNAISNDLQKDKLDQLNK